MNHELFKAQIIWAKQWKHEIIHNGLQFLEQNESGKVFMLKTREMERHICSERNLISMGFPLSLHSLLQLTIALHLFSMGT
mmetsp:Transcript_21983/g.21679  ORF Transcript_21983/g.21679 Transcript_21983/m.21679 type:complete len:81 (-) Transcript_21983:202-444(-)